MSTQFLRGLGGKSRLELEFKLIGEGGGGASFDLYLIPLMFTAFALFSPALSDHPERCYCGRVAGFRGKRGLTEDVKVPLRALSRARAPASSSVQADRERRCSESGSSAKEMEPNS